MFGRLFQPRHVNAVARTAELMPWAADNDAFHNFDEPRFRAMLERLEGHPGCLFVAAPDVVGDADTTLERFQTWGPAIRRKLPVALVAQDGLTLAGVPWEEIDALFIGGTTEWKMGGSARRLVDAARARRVWVHMGRVNSYQRAVYAAAIGCDSVDGSGVARFDQTRRMVQRVAEQPFQQVFP